MTGWHRVRISLLVFVFAVSIFPAHLAAKWWAEHTLERVSETVVSIPSTDKREDAAKFLGYPASPPMLISKDAERVYQQCVLNNGVYDIFRARACGIIYDDARGVYLNALRANEKPHIAYFWIYILIPILVTGLVWCFLVWVEWIYRGFNSPKMSP